MQMQLTVPDRSDFLANLAQVRENIARAAAQAGRRPEEITIGAVTKTFDASAARLAAEAGLNVICENRVQEAAEKFSGTRYGAELHLIGHLQTNKAARAAALADSIDSVDSLRLAQILNREAEKLGRRLRVLVEVNIGEDPAKSGVSPEKTEELCEQIAGMPFLRLEGLMTILPLGCSHGEKMKYFQKISQQYIDLREQKGYTDFRQLSMGMSDDYVEAVLCGATMLRIGTALFGKREYRR